MVLLFDTNAVLKRYISETGSDVINELIGLADLRRGRLVSHAVLLEAQAVLSWKFRLGKLRRPEYQRLSKALEDQRNEIWTEVPVASGVLDAARAGVREHYFRGADAFDHVHIQTALNLSALFEPKDKLVFVTSDQKLRKVAKLQKLACFDPEREPIGTIELFRA